MHSRVIKILENQLTLANRPDGQWFNMQEKRLRNRIRNVWLKQNDWVINKLAGSRYFPDAVATNQFKYQKNQLIAELEFFLSDLPGAENIAEYITVSMGLSMVRGSKRLIDRFKLGDFGISFSLEHPQARKILQEKNTLEKLSNYRGNIHGTTKAKLVDILKDGIENGISYSELSQRINEQTQAGVFSQARGELIATREIGQAYGDSQHIVLQDFIAQNPEREVEKRWNTVGDSEVRATHRQNEQDDWIPFTQVFSGTQEQRAPSNDFGCRCATEYNILPPK